MVLISIWGLMFGVPVYAQDSSVAKRLPHSQFPFLKQQAPSTREQRSQIVMELLLQDIQEQVSPLIRPEQSSSFLAWVKKHLHRRFVVLVPSYTVTQDGPGFISIQYLFAHKIFWDDLEKAGYQKIKNSPATSISTSLNEEISVVTIMVNQQDRKIYMLPEPPTQALLSTDSWALLGGKYFSGKSIQEGLINQSQLPLDQKLGHLSSMIIGKLPKNSKLKWSVDISSRLATLLNQQQRVFDSKWIWPIDMPLNATFLPRENLYLFAFVVGSQNSSANLESVDLMRFRSSKTYSRKSWSRENQDSGLKLPSSKLVLKLADQLMEGMDSVHPVMAGIRFKVSKKVSDKWVQKLESLGPKMGSQTSFTLLPREVTKEEVVYATSVPLEKVSAVSQLLKEELTELLVSALPGDMGIISINSKP